MIYIRLENFVPVKVSAEHPKCQGDGKAWAFDINGENTGTGWMNRNDIKSFAYASTLAALLTEKLGKLYLPADAGPHTYPQYDVFEAPNVGDEVSRSFYGDTYPCGTITKITPTFQITTSDGTKFRRYKETSGFRQAGRGFWLVAGNHYEQNPSF